MAVFGRASAKYEAGNTFTAVLDSAAKGSARAGADIDKAKAAAKFRQQLLIRMLIPVGWRGSYSKLRSRPVKLLKYMNCL
jgi:hypothetical protein